MGAIDIMVLHPIYRQCIFLAKEYKYPFVFKEDSGDYETMIEFCPVGSKYAVAHPPESHNWDEMKLINSIPICPDIMDFDARIIIEVEEESTPGKSSGKFGKKGHWAESKRDTRRDELYKTTGQAKQARLRAIVRTASSKGKLDSINLGKLAKMPLKDMAKFKKTL